MSEWKRPQRILDLEEWSKGEKRVTTFSLMKRFDVSREVADMYYEYLQGIGIVGRMGYVNEGVRQNG